MTLRVFGLFILFSLSGYAIHAQDGSSSYKPTRGSDLYHDCQAAIRIMDQTAKDVDYHDAEFCRGYFTAFGEFNDMENTSICLGGSTIGTTVRVYVAYMEENPKSMDLMMIIGVIDALKEAYPCPDPKSK